MTQSAIGGACALALSATTALGATGKAFLSTWTAPGAGPLNFAGRKVVALVIVDDDNLRMSAEEALAREISARGPVGIAAHRLIPREELMDRDRAKPWFDRAGAEGAVIMRVLAADTDKVYSSVVWSSGYYANVWDYYGYGWTTVTPIGKARTELTITVETLLYDLRSASPIWAGVSRTTDPKSVGSFMADLVKDVAKELEKAGLSSRTR